DGDGDLDLIDRAAPLQIWINDGNGTFELHPGVFNPFGAQALAVGDFDGDGALDVFSAQNQGQRDTVWLSASANASVEVTTTSEASVWSDGVIQFLVEARNTSQLALDGVALKFTFTGEFTDLYLTHIEVANDSSTTLDLGPQSTVLIDTLSLPIGGKVQYQFDAVLSGSTVHAAAEALPVGLATQISLPDGVLDGNAGDNVGVNYKQVENAGHEGLAVFDRAPIDFETSGSNDVTAGDLDGDGDLDLILANQVDDSQVLLNDGQGSFSPGPALPASVRSSSFVKLGDLDRDGDLDAVMSRGILLNDGNAAFTVLTTDIPYVQDGNFGDFNGDGYVDAVLKTDDPRLLWLNDGTGLLVQQPLAVFGGTDSAYDVVDIDGDGDLDFLVQDRIFLNPGNGEFSVSSGVFTGIGLRRFADLDGDGDLDAFVGGNFAPSRVFLNDGVGGFVATTQLLGTSQQHTAVALADLDGDFDLDAVVSVNGVDEVWLNLGDGRFVAGAPIDHPGNTGAILLGDFNGDTAIDAYFANAAGLESELVDGLYFNASASLITDVRVLAESSTTSVVEGATTTYQTVVTNLGEQAVYGIEFRDQFSAGFSDLQLTSISLSGGAASEAVPQPIAASNFTDVISLPPQATIVYTYEATLAGSGEAGSVTDGMVGHVAEAWALGSWIELRPLDNRTADYDIVYPYSAPSSAQFAWADAPFGDNAIRGLALADLDGDGDLDAIAIEEGLQRNPIWLNNGDGTYVDSGWSLENLRVNSAVATVDIDRDGDLDIVTNAAGPVVWRNDGETGFSVVQLEATGFGSTMALADFNGDGYVDALFAGASNALWLNDGTGHLDSGGLVSRQRFNVVVAGDVDGDGDVDAVMLQDGQWSTWHNDGSGRLAQGPAVVSLDEVQSGSDARLGDLDGDGDL
ncbi:MAG: VCBS repeat-containing protein, partial [Planctomycetales bacterium]|nr:VCBS repeat-containing protein [Planctomycetales bacterium]